MNLLTRRIPTILGLLLLAAAVFGAAYYFRTANTLTDNGIVPEKVRITNVADNKFSVSWTSKNPTVGKVEYGEVGEKLGSVATDERSGSDEYLTHHVTIENLQPSTQYAFRILVGDKPVRFDNNGSPYTASTGPVIGATPTSHNFYGKIELPSKQPADGALAYLTLPGGATASTIVRESGNYTFTLSTMRSADLRSYVSYDPAASIASLTADSGTEQSTVSISLANSAPSPTITLGQDAEFLNEIQPPSIAEVVPTTPVSSPTTAETPAIFNVEPLSEPEINAVTTGSVIILNPKDEGEILATLRPEFRGTGPAGTTLSIALTGQKAISDTVKIATDKTWSWAPVIDLKVGVQKIAISYLNSDGKSEKVEKTFSVSASKTTSDPAFVASASASTAPNSKTPTPTPRAGMPATDSGVPVTGVIENTLLTAGLGIVIMVVGAMLFAL